MSEDAGGSPQAQRTFRGDWAALYNPNVRRVLIFCFVDGACFSLWFSYVFQVLINITFGDTTVGWLSATSGMAQMVGALIAGFSDGLPRQTIIRLGAFSGVVAAALFLFGVAVLQVHIFFFASVLWGMYSGMAYTGVEALFADSIESGRRDFAYNLKWVNQTLCSCVGSAASLVMLVNLGNKWNVSSLKTLMYTGVSLHPIAQLLLFTLKDKYALDGNAGGQASPCSVASEDTGAPDVTAKTKSPTQTGEQFLGSDDDGESPRQPLVSEPRVRSAAPSSASVVVGSPTSSEAVVAQREAIIAMLTARSAQKQREYLQAQEGRGPVARVAASVCHYASKLFEWSTVPYLVCLFDFLMAVGSGMTMRYIPLFFVNDYHVTPVLLMSTYIVISISTAAISSLVRYMGERYVSRVVAAFSVRFIGTTLLLLMGLTHLKLFILLPIFVLRNSLMNSTMGVTRSIIMDCVPKSSRAKWSAFESFASLTWAGSAVIGGYIATAKGYQYTFVVTAGFHYCALLALIPAMYGAREVERAQRERRWREDASERERKKALRVPRSVDTVSLLTAVEGCGDTGPPLGKGRGTVQ